MENIFMDKVHKTAVLQIQTIYILIIKRIGTNLENVVLAFYVGGGVGPLIGGSISGRDDINPIIDFCERQLIRTMQCMRVFNAHINIGVKT